MRPELTFLLLGISMTMIPFVMIRIYERRTRYLSATKKIAKSIYQSFVTETDEIDRDWQRLNSNIKFAQRIEKLAELEKKIAEFEAKYKGRCYIWPYVSELHQAISRRTLTLTRRLIEQ